MSTLSLATILSESARRFPDKVAVIEGERRVTYDELWHQARQYAHHLMDSGVAAGDRVAILCPNTVEFVRAYYGVLTAGAAVVPIPTVLQEDEIEYMLSDSGARRLIVPDEPSAAARAAADRAGARIL